MVSVTFTVTKFTITSIVGVVEARCLANQVMETMYCKPSDVVPVSSITKLPGIIGQGRGREK